MLNSLSRNKLLEAFLLDKSLKSPQTITRWGQAFSSFYLFLVNGLQALSVTPGCLNAFQA